MSFLLHKTLFAVLWKGEVFSSLLLWDVYITPVRKREIGIDIFSRSSPGDGQCAWNSGFLLNRKGLVSLGWSPEGVAAGCSTGIPRGNKFTKYPVSTFRPRGSCHGFSDVG